MVPGSWYITENKCFCAFPLATKLYMVPHHLLFTISFQTSLFSSRTLLQVESSMEPQFLTNKSKAVLVQGRSKVKDFPVLCLSSRSQGSACGFELHSAQLETPFQTELLPHLSTTVPRHNLNNACGKGHTPSQMSCNTMKYIGG